MTQVFEIREMAVCIIGQLSSMKPAYIMPALRKLLIQLLTELEHSGMGHNKEHSSRLLGKLVSSAPRLIKPYMEPILKSKRRSISARQISTRFCLFFM